MKTNGRKNARKAASGFTLVEMLLAVTISVMVFFAMGMVLSRCFALWKDATANWRLAQYARLSRERILCGGFTNPACGLLSASNAVVTVPSGWRLIEYETVADSGVQRVYGWSGEAEQNIWLNHGSSWAYGQGISAPTVFVDSFAASTSNDVVDITYRLRLSAAGKLFTQLHTIQANLVNKE